MLTTNGLQDIKPFALSMSKGERRIETNPLRGQGKGWGERMRDPPHPKLLPQAQGGFEF